MSALNTFLWGSSWLFPLFKESRSKSSEEKEKENTMNFRFLILHWKEEFPQQTIRVERTIFSEQGDEKKKKKASNKVVELTITPRTHGYTQTEIDKYFELEVCRDF